MSSDLAANPPILDYASVPTQRWLVAMRRWRRLVLKIVFGMLLGACVGLIISPPTRYRTTALFRADPLGRVGHGTPAEHDALLREFREIETAAFATLRSRDLPEI